MIIPISTVTAHFKDATQSHPPWDSKFPLTVVLTVHHLDGTSQSIDKRYLPFQEDERPIKPGVKMILKNFIELTEELGQKVLAVLQGNYQEEKTANWLQQNRLCRLRRGNILRKKQFKENPINAKRSWRTWDEHIDAKEKTCNEQPKKE